MSRLALLSVLVLAPFAAADDPARVAPDVAVLARDNNAFAFDLYARLRQDKGKTNANLFCSPYSISTALAMTYGGARGETADEMARTLHFKLEPDRLHREFAELTRELNGRGLPRDYSLQVANSLWGDKTLAVRPEFQTLIRDNYGCRLRPVDFGRQHDAARKIINRWVEGRTNDKIKELLLPPDVTPLTAMVLVNAIYFKAGWKEPFDLEDTDLAAKFTTAAGETATVPQMRRAGEYRYLDADGVQIVELPYEGDDLAMVVLLPKAADGLAKVEGGLTADRLAGWLKGMKETRVNVGLPRFKTASRFSLAEELKAMGMPSAFDGRADFSGISAEKLAISKVIHQAYVDVNEVGTEAAAATAVVLARPAGPIEDKTAVQFRADHPFLFLVRDTRTGSILFLGRLNDPKGEAN